MISYQVYFLFYVFFSVILMFYFKFYIYSILSTKQLAKIQKTLLYPEILFLNNTTATTTTA